MRTITLLVAAILSFSCAKRQRTVSDAKVLPFPVTGKAEAMSSFQDGLRLLHNFEYEDAAEAFVAAQKIDSNFVMAYWGEAMTHNHPVWQTLDLREAREVLSRLGATREERIGKALTSLEKDFLTSIEILYGEGPTAEREKRYADFLAGMYNEYQDQTEVAAFYCLSLLGLKNGWGEMEDVNFEAERIAKKILERNPAHPGALHYRIHSDDHPEYARYALNAASDYARIASYAGHALHMPSHIYLALGMWRDVVNSNEVAWQASLDRKSRKKLDNDALDYHSHWWLSYGYLQQGRVAEAAAAVEKQSALTQELPSAGARYHLLMMKGHYLTETLDWASTIADINVNTDDLNLQLRAVNRVVNGLGAFHRKDQHALDGLVESLADDIKKMSAMGKLANEGIAVCGANVLTDEIPSPVELNNAEILLGQLSGMRSWLAGDAAGARASLQRAVALSGGYLVGPPKIIKPTQELYGEFLLAHDKPEEAVGQFEASLKVAPNRILSLKGLQRALLKTGDDARAREIEATLEDLLISTNGKAGMSSFDVN